MNTKTCVLCEKDYQPSSHKQKYCSKSCANKDRGPRPNNICKACGVPVMYYRTFCDEHKYGHSGRYDKYIKDWLDGKVTGVVSGGLGVSAHIKRYIMIRAKGACELCGFDKVHPKDGKSILELDHIDGDYLNNSPDNLRYICPNCHSLTDTYRARNTGKGRLSRRLRYVEDKKRVEKTCLDCGAIVTRNAVRCRSHAQIHAVHTRKTVIDWPSDEELVAMVSNMPMTTVGARLGVSDNAVRKRMKTRGLTPQK